MPRRVSRWIVPALWVGGVAAALLLIFPLGFPNYDTIYALLWGREMAHGASPDYGAVLPPTPHPLADLVGFVATLLGGGAITATMVIAYASLGLIAYLVYRLGSLWFDRPIGVLAALIVLTRAPYLSNGLRAYVDLPYIALCLGALTIETKRPRAGWPVLALLVPAGLLRPEAWLFSLAYWLWLAFAVEIRLPPAKTGATGTPPSPTGEKPPPSPTGRKPEDSSGNRPVGDEGGGPPPATGRKAEHESGNRPVGAGEERGGLRGTVRLRGERDAWELARLAALALAAPILWALFDLITTGSPTHSFTGTRDTVETLARQTGPVDFVLYGPRRLGEVLQWPGLVGAVGGIVFTLACMPRRAAIGVVAAILALAAFAVLSCAGLAILPRYTMLAAAVLAIFCAATLLGWRLLRRDHPWRRAWQALALVVVAMFVVWGPNQYDLLHRVDTDLANQGQIEDDLEDLVDSGAFDPLCGPISVPNHRAVPRLAFGLDVRPTRIVSSSEQRQLRRGYFLDPASPFVVHNFILDPNDPRRLKSHVPPGFRPVASNRSWRLYRRC